MRRQIKIWSRHYGHLLAIRFSLNFAITEPDAIARCLLYTRARVYTRPRSPFRFVAWPPLDCGRGESSRPEVTKASPRNNYCNITPQLIYICNINIFIFLIRNRQNGRNYKCIIVDERAASCEGATIHWTERKRFPILLVRRVSSYFKKDFWNIDWGFNKKSLYM